MLDRQLRRHLEAEMRDAPALRGFLAAVDKAYRHADLQHDLVARSLDLMSEELNQRNQELSERVRLMQEAEAALMREKAEQAQLIHHLEAAHHQLLQSEKMASIGQLAAGVAHEINNPIGFVNSNMGTLRGYVEQLLVVLDAHEAAFEYVPDGPARARIETVRATAELEYLKSDITDLLDESSDGLARVRRIVQDLKDFSHNDQGEWGYADLHKGLDSTLNVVNNEIKYKARVIKEYGVLPMIRCLPSQLNQVFLNLLVNAAHAIDEQGEIVVRTGVEGDPEKAGEVWVEIRDSGRGIPRHLLTRIFDPFFTTKQVGKGTGLGLYISYGIVHKHGGRIEVDSEAGRGSVFRVTLPIHPNESQENAHD
jgi:signal transduction histidine kinase